MQTIVPNITNVVADISSPSNSRSNSDVNNGNHDRDDFARMVERASDTDRKAPAPKASDDIAETRAKEARSEDAKNDYSKTDKPKADSDKPEETKVADKSDTKTDKANAKPDSGKTDKPNKADDAKEDDGKVRASDSASAGTVDELLDQDGGASDDALASPVGGSITPDVTAILTDASSVQAAGDTNLLTASTQPIGLLALAALMEKAMAAMEAQKLAANQKANTATNLTVLSAPVSPVLTDEVVANVAAVDDATPLVDVLGEQQVELPGQVKPQTLAATAVTDTTNKADAIINAVKQVAQPIAEQTQMQLKIAAEEVIDPADALAQVTSSPETSKVVQKFLTQTAEPEGKKSTVDLLASLKEVLSHRGEKDNVLPLGQAVTALHGADLGTLTQDDSTLALGQGNANIMSQLAADALRHTATASRTDAGFANMLDKTTNHVPVADQVLVNIKQAVADGASHIKIQLHPEDLGRVDVRMSVGADGKTGITIMADNRDTLDMLQREARNLERSLTDLGLKPDAGGLSFHLRQQNQDQKFTRQQTGYTAVAEIDADEPAPMTNMAAYRLTVNEGVDIRV